MFKSDKSVSNFFKKNYCYNIFILFSKFFMRFQFTLKSYKSILEIFKKKMTEQMSRIRLNMYFHFVNFYIKLKLIVIKYKLLISNSNPPIRKVSINEF